MSEVAQILERESAISKMMTPGGKVLKVHHVRNTSLYGVSFTDGGELPKQLRGRFTSGSKATDAARAYLNRMWDESDKVAEKQAKAQARKGRTTAKSDEGTDGKTES